MLKLLTVTWFSMYRIKRWFALHEDRRLRLPTVCLVCAVLLYGVYFSAYQLQRHRAFWTNIDTVNMEQTLWNTLNGNFARSTVYPPTGGTVKDFTGRRTVSRLGSHVQPIQLVLLLPYALFQRPETLLLLMAVAPGLGAISVYRIARRRLPSPWWAFIFAVGYLFIPAVETSSSWDVHGNTFVLPLLLAAFDAMDAGKRGWWWLWTLLAMGCREDIPFLAGWAMVWMAPKSRRREALTMFGVGLALSLLSFFVIVPAFGGGGTPYVVRFLPAGTPLNPEALLTLLRQPAFWRRELVLFVSYNVRLALPVFFLYWLYWPAVMAAAPLLAINGLSWYTGASFPSLFHYSTPAMPWVIIGAIEGFERLARFLHRRRPTLRWRVVLAEVLLVTVAITNYMEGYLPWSRAFIWPRRTGREPAMAAVLEQVPADATLSAEMQLLAHAARRETLRFFPDTRAADWIALDFWYGLYPYGSFNEIWPQIRTDPHWETVLAADGLVLLQRGNGPPEGLAAAFRPDPTLSLEPLRVQFGTEARGLRLVGLETRPRPVNYLFLCTDWEIQEERGLVPQVAISSSSGTDFASLDAPRFVPDTFRRSGLVRDCTSLLSPLQGGEIPVRLVVRDAGGVRVPVQIEEPGAWEANLSVEDSVLVIHVPPWW